MKIVKKAVKFDLIINDEKIMNVEDLQQHLNLELVNLWLDDRLVRWLKSRDEIELADKFDSIIPDANVKIALKQIADILGCEINESELNNLELATNAKEQFLLGNNYYHGQDSKEQDFAKALEWYAKAAEQGDADAQFHLGCSYFNGYGLTIDKQLAKRWLQLAAEQGHESAQDVLNTNF